MPLPLPGAPSLLPAPMSDPLDPARLPTSIPGILRHCLPFAVGYGLGYFMHFINRLFLSWWSTDALAAAMPAGFMAWTVQSFFITAAGYLGTFAAQHHGAGERREAGAMVWPMITVCGIATVLALALIPARHLLVGLFGTEPGVAREMAELFAWYMAETGPITLALGIGSFIGGIGRPVLILVMSLFTCALSVLLNHWLIFGGLGVPALGVRGAGIATLCASIATLAVWLAILFAPGLRRDYGTWAERNLDLGRLWRFCRFAAPKGGTEVLEMVGFLSFTAAVSHLGTIPLAAHNLVFNIYLVVMVPFIGFFNGMSVLVGQAQGAGRSDLARTITWRSMLVATATMALLAVVFVGFPDLLLLPYANDGSDPSRPLADWNTLAAVSRTLLAFAGVAMVADVMQFAFRSGVQGAGDTRWPLVALTALAVLLLAVPAALIAGLARHGLWPAWAGDALLVIWTGFTLYVWVVALVMWARWRHGPWPRMSVRA